MGFRFGSLFDGLGPVAWRIACSATLFMYMLGGGHEKMGPIEHGCHDIN